MAASTAQVTDAAKVDIGSSKDFVWEKQVSTGTTVVPEGDDFSRFTTEAMNEVCGFDEYETRGGMAVTPPRQLLTLPEEHGEPLTTSVGDQEFDYETRGGLANNFRTAQGCDVDAYEVRGGMAAKLAWELKSAPDHQEVPSVFVGDREVDFFETRGGMVHHIFAKTAHDSEPDAYEVRGGMASKLGWQLRQLPEQRAATEAMCVGGEELDFYETRGGMAEMFSSEQGDSIDAYEVRGGMAVKSSKQLLPEPAVPPEPPAVFMGGQELDFYEARGSMVKELGRVAEASELDAYEVRGGMAAAMSSHLVKAPEPSQGTPCLRMGGQELDFYEARGGIAGKFQVEEASGLDPYETRGGMSASVSAQLLKAPEQRWELLVSQLGNLELDFYEARGGMAGLLWKDACEADAYEVRGGMAEEMWPRLLEAPEPKMEVETEPAGDMELDFYEMRGGMIEYCRKAAEVSIPDAYELRGGLAAAFSGQLLQAPAVGGTRQDLDFYELRGGMAEQFLKEAEAMDNDEYEVRGGLAKQTSPKLPVFRTEPGAPRGAADEGDEYEARGGQSAALHKLLPSLCSIA